MRRQARCRIFPLPCWQPSSHPPRLRLCASARTRLSDSHLEPTFDNLCKVGEPEIWIVMKSCSLTILLPWLDLSRRVPASVSSIADLLVGALGFSWQPLYRSTVPGSHRVHDCSWFLARQRTRPRAQVQPAARRRLAPTAVALFAFVALHRDVSRRRRGRLGRTVRLCSDRHLDPAAFGFAVRRPGGRLASGDAFLRPPLRELVQRCEQRARARPSTWR